MPVNHYVTLGRSGLRVSPLCLGAMTFGEDWGWGSSVADSQTIIDRYLAICGNFIDTANGYTKGHSEKIIGDHIGRVPHRRDRVVLATKFLSNLYRGDPNGGGSHRKAVFAQCEQSLRRLQTDYIDLYWMHAFDATTPIEETMRALDATPAPVDPATLPALPRSSLAAVILHRSELGLTDDQVRELEQIDQRRESEDAAARADLAPKAKSATASANNAGGGGGGTTAPTGAPAAGSSGSGMGGGRMGGMRGGRMGGRGFRAPDNSGPSSGQRAAKLEDRIDDDDTKAYLDGEAVLTEPQREQAREIASDYRAQIYDRRELLKQKANGK